MATKRRQIPNPQPTGVGKRLNPEPARYMRAAEEGFQIVICPRRTGMSESAGQGGRDA